MSAPRWAAAVAATALLSASILHARVLGDGRGAAGSDCLIALDPFDAGAVAPFGPKARPAITCRDCDPACDRDGVAQANGACEFRVTACLNAEGVPGCAPAALSKARALAKPKGGARLDFSPPVPATASSVCGAESPVSVPVRTTRKGERPGTAALTLLATAAGRPRDRDRLLLVCAPRPTGDPCPMPATTTTTLPPAPPAPPASLRLGPAPDGPPEAVLRWTLDPTSPPVDAFLVHDAAGAAGPADATLLATLSGTARAAPIPIRSATGVHRFRVTAVGADGQTSVSPDLVIDTTPRVVFIADKATNDVFELFSIVPGSGAEPTPLSGALVQNGDVDRFFFAPDGRHVVFAADKEVDGFLELFVVALDGATPPIKVSGTNVAGGGPQPFLVQFSPDASRLAFVADRNVDERFELFVAARDGSSEPVAVSGALADGGDIDVDEFSWSPDGTRLAFLADKLADGVNELFVVEAAGGVEPVRVSGALVPGGQVEAFAWSPDGARLAFRADKETDGRIELFVGPPDDSAEPVRVSGVLADFAQINSDPLWSPDSSRIAFSGDLLTNAVFEVFVAPADASAGPFRVSGSSQPFSDIVGFRWSPDATRIAFNMDKNADNADEVFVADAAGTTEPIRVSGAFGTGEESFNVQWSPRGDRVAYFANPNVANQEEAFVALADVVDGALPASGAPDVGEDVFQFAWSPDGASLVLVGDLETDGVSEVFVTPAVGGGTPTTVSGTMTPGGGAGSFSFGFAPLGFLP